MITRQLVSGGASWDVSGDLLDAILDTVPFEIKYNHDPSQYSLCFISANLHSHPRCSSNDHAKLPSGSDTEYKCSR